LNNNNTSTTTANQKEDNFVQPKTPVSLVLAQQQQQQQSFANPNESISSTVAEMGQNSTIEDFNDTRQIENEEFDSSAAPSAQPQQLMSTPMGNTAANGIVAPSIELKSTPKPIENVNVKPVHSALNVAEKKESKKVETPTKSSKKSSKPNKAQSVVQAPIQAQSQQQPITQTKSIPQAPHLPNAPLHPQPIQTQPVPQQQQQAYYYPANNQPNQYYNNNSGQFQNPAYVQMAPQVQPQQQQQQQPAMNYYNVGNYHHPGVAQAAPMQHPHQMAQQPHYQHPPPYSMPMNAYNQAAAVQQQMPNGVPVQPYVAANGQPVAHQPYAHPPQAAMTGYQPNYNQQWNWNYNNNNSYNQMQQPLMSNNPQPQAFPYQQVPTSTYQHMETSNMQMANGYQSMPQAQQQAATFAPPPSQTVVNASNADQPTYATLTPAYNANTAASNYYQTNATTTTTYYQSQ
jgi:hypothetical protein